MPGELQWVIGKRSVRLLLPLLFRRKLLYSLHRKDLLSLFLRRLEYAAYSHKKVASLECEAILEALGISV